MNAPNSGGSQPPASALLWLGLWTALLAGFTEVAVLLYRHVAGGDFIHRSRDFLWLTPAGYLLLFAVPVLFLYSLRRTTLVAHHAGVFLVVAAGVASVLLLLFGDRLHPAALALFTLGVAAQGARFARRKPETLTRLARRSTPWLLGLWLACGVATLTARAWTERRAEAALPRVANGELSVLLLILDTVRAASLGLYGYPKETTPELERWARRGVVFDRAIATSPWTLPSHASLFTGRLPHELSADWLTPLDGSAPTLAEVMRERGYRTGGFVANLLYATWEHGLARGFAHYEDYPFSLGMLIRHTAPGRRLTDIRRLRALVGSDELIGRKSAARLGGDFLRWLDRAPDRPFFAFLNYYDAHEPYLPPQDFYRKFAGVTRPDQLSPLRRWTLAERRDRVSSEDLRVEIAGYDGAIAYLDDALGRLFAELERRGRLDRTLIIVTSDHGEEFGEHEVFYHGHTLYRQSLHVPLLLLAPGRVPAGYRVPQVVSLRDVPATIASLVGLPMGSFSGRSLGRFWEDPTLADDAALSEVTRGIRIPAWYPAAADNLESVVTRGVHFIRGAGREEVFDWNLDPEELHNERGVSGRAELVARLRAMLPRAGRTADSVRSVP